LIQTWGGDVSKQKEPMKEVEIQFENVGSNDKLSYIKADLFKAGRIGGSFALSCYQMDYQSLINELTTAKGNSIKETPLLPVSKLVMDYEGFMKLRHEINTLHDNFMNQNKISKKQ